MRGFVEEGGRLVVMEEAADFAASLFGLEISNAVAGLPNTEFYVPGSILRVELAARPGHRRLRRLDRGVVLAQQPRLRRGRRTGRGGGPLLRRRDPVIAGWVLGREKLAGKPALLRARIGRGEVIIFGFQPNYRGQSIVTWPLLFNAISGGRMIG